MKCLVCGLQEVGEEDSYDLCTICGRENESWGMKDDEFGGANYFTVNDHRELWKLDRSRSWNVSGANSATKIDTLARYIEKNTKTKDSELSFADYKKVFEECKRLISQPNFNIDTEIDRLAARNRLG